MNLTVLPYTFRHFHLFLGLEGEDAALVDFWC